MAKSLQNKVDAIRINFIRSLPQRLEKIEYLAQKLISGEDNTVVGKELVNELHNLRGFSGSHGLEGINELSGVAEELADVFHYTQGMPTAADKARLQSAISALGLQARSIEHGGGKEGLILDTAPHKISGRSPLILIVDDDRDFCDMLALQLEHLGYRTKYIYELEELEQSINTYNPQAIFMDIIFNGNHDAGLKIIMQLRESTEIISPIVYLSARDDIDARLQAVRNGGVAFLGKLFNLGDLKNVLDIVVPLKKSSYKVLIVDDDVISSEFCKAILEHADMKVRTLDNQEKIFESITGFDPDLILLDMYMPNISGFELANVIRQHINFTAIPIVIMSAETDINKQIEMRSAGADDFILKPFKPAHLVSTIQSRIQRSRQTKRMIYTDGLTGLMLFPKIKEQIVTLFESCQRYNLEFTIALLDLDHFKLVNDQYGHLVGDEVLRNLAELMLTRLRRSDIVTRYGGEEFAIIFPYTSINQAEVAVNLLRESFANLLHHCKKADFNVTFSAGLASIHNYQELSELLNAADKALYKAKETGRNKISIAK